MAEQADIDLTPNELRLFYANYFSYYTTLSEEYKELFIKRCTRFISDKIIEGDENFKPDNRVKAIVAGSAVQLTLGLEKWDMSFFGKVIIHPSDFDSEYGGLKFKGETNLRGYIRLSWKSLIHGYKIKDDNINLGLHEFSHALRFNSVKGHGQDYFIEHYFYNWLGSAYPVFYDIKNNRETIFRKYGGANINEFISVCIEHYFESPEEIKEHYPLLYYSTAILLNQLVETNKTEIGVREKMLQKKNALLPGFSNHTLHTSTVHSNTFKVLMVMLVPLFCIWIVTGIDSGLSLFFILICFLIWLRFDFRYTQIGLHNREFTSGKGLFLFRGRKKQVFPASHLISVRATGASNPNHEWEVIFYNGNDGYFYEEKIHSSRLDADLFLKELHTNKIAYFNNNSNYSHTPLRKRIIA